MIVLEDYINKSIDSETVQLDKVPSYSRHSTLSKRLLNEVLADNPKYYGLIKAIAAFPVQKWAQIARNKIGLGTASLSSE